MLKKIAFTGVGVALLMTPLISSADTLSDLQAQMQNLLAQVKTLQAQLSASTDTSSATGSNEFSSFISTSNLINQAFDTPNTTVSCVVSRPLALGASGDDVKCLQTNLAKDPTIYPDAVISGYFGPLTQAAVQRYQAKAGIVTSGSAETTGFGVVGPRTITQLTTNGFTKLTTGSSTPWPPLSPSPTVTVSPTSGAAPLSVVFRSNTSGTITFGDGTSGTMTADCTYGVTTNSIGSDVSCSTGSYYVSHTYSTAGTYTGTLKRGSLCGQANGPLFSPLYCDDQTLGTAIVTVTGLGTPWPSPSPTFTAIPGSGTAPLSVVFRSSTSGTITFGDGTSGTLSADCAYGVTTNSLLSNAVCSTGSYYVSHTYSSAGTYTATIGTPGSCPLGFCGQAQSVTVTVNAVTGGIEPRNPTLTVSPTSGAAPLSVVFRSNTSGTITFGDGTSGTMTADCTYGVTTNSIGSDVSCSTGSYYVSHTYSTAGTYTGTLVTAGSCPLGFCGQAQSVMVTVTGGNSAACQVTDIYAEQVPGYVNSNLYMKVRNLPSASATLAVASVSITGAESWDNLTFSRISTDINGVTTLRANQTVGSVGIGYILDRKYAIKPINSGTAAISCAPMSTSFGGVGASYDGAVAVGASASPNLANALTALEGALKALIARFGQ